MNKRYPNLMGELEFRKDFGLNLNCATTDDWLFLFFKHEDGQIKVKATGMRNGERVELNGAMAPLVAVSIFGDKCLDPESVKREKMRREEEEEKKMNQPQKIIKLNSGDELDLRFDGKDIRAYLTRDSITFAIKINPLDVEEFISELNKLELQVQIAKPKTKGYKVYRSKMKVRKLPEESIFNGWFNYLTPSDRNEYEEQAELLGIEDDENEQ